MRPGDVGLHPLPFAQISLWRRAGWNVADGEQAVKGATGLASECKRRGIRTVIHPIDYFLSCDDAATSLAVLRRLAAVSDLGLIIHDEGGPGGRRLLSAEEELYQKNLGEISSLCPVSIENAFNSLDCLWFWERFVAPADAAVSITLDIGHLESADIDSIAFIRDMPQRLVERIRFVHMHHKAGERYGIKDHWPLVPECREIEALATLLSRTKDLRVILELDAQEAGMRESIELLRDLDNGEGAEKR